MIKFLLIDDNEKRLKKTSEDILSISKEAYQNPDFVNLTSLSSVTRGTFEDDWDYIFMHESNEEYSFVRKGEKDDDPKDWKPYSGRGFNTKLIVFSGARLTAFKPKGGYLYLPDCELVDYIEDNIINTWWEG